MRYIKQYIWTLDKNWSNLIFMFLSYVDRPYQVFVILKRTVQSALRCRRNVWRRIGSIHSLQWNAFVNCAREIIVHTCDNVKFQCAICQTDHFQNKRWICFIIEWNRHLSSASVVIMILLNSKSICFPPLRNTRNKNFLSIRHRIAYHSDGQCLQLWCHLCKMYQIPMSPKKCADICKSDKNLLDS